MCPRRFVGLAFVAVCLLACSRPEEPFRIALVTPSATDDLAYSQSMWSALVAVQAKLGGPDEVQVALSEELSDVDAAAAALRGYAEQEYDLVIAHGVQYGPSVEALAPQFPRVSFAWGNGGETFGAPNVFAYTAAADEGGYVNGVVAALLTQSKRVAVLGPVDAGDASRYADGFAAGVHATDPAVEVGVVWTGSFSDEALMSAAAEAQMAEGADVLTGSSQAVAGAIAAAKRHGGVLWFGTQWDPSPLAPGVVVASQLYDWREMLQDLVSHVRAGERGGAAYRLTLRNGGLSVVFDADYPIPQNARAAGEAAVTAIIEGRVGPTY